MTRQNIRRYLMAGLLLVLAPTVLYAMASSGYSLTGEFDGGGGTRSSGTYQMLLDSIGGIGGTASTSASYSLAGGVVAAATDFYPPLGSIVLDNGATKTRYTYVNAHLTATDNTGVTGYYLSEVSTRPTLTDPLWTAVTSTRNLSTSLVYQLSPDDGAKTLYAWFKDAAGNVSLSSVANITVDSSGTAYSTTDVPGLVISTLPDNSHTTDSTLNITGVVADPGSVQTVLVGSDPVTLNPDGSFSVAVVLVPGDNLIQITVIDTSGNPWTISRTIYLDASAPVFLVTAPVDGLQTARNTVALAGTADPGFPSVTYRVNDDTAAAAHRTGSDFDAVANLKAGMNTIYMVASGVTGSTQTAKRTVFYDFRKPGLAITGPATDVTISSATYTFAGTVTDALTEVTVTVRAEGMDYNPAVDGNGSFTQAVTFTQEGIYPVIVTAMDQNGTTTSVARTIRYQRGSVVINKGAYATTKATVTLDLAYSAVTGTASTMQLLYNNTAWTAPMAFAARKSVTLPAGDGIKTVFARFIDSNGGVSPVYSDTIILDTRVPAGGITINDGAYSTQTRTVTVSVVATDVNSIVKMQFSNDNLKWTEKPFAVKTPWVLAGADNLSGTRTVYTKFIDGAGKISAVMNDTILYTAATTTTSGGQVEIRKGARYTTSTSVPVQFTAPGGNTMFQTSTNGKTWGAWSSIATSKTMTVTLPAGDGVKTVYAQFKTGTNSTAVGPYSDTIILDTIPPVGTIQINDGLYSTNSRTVNLTLTATDLNGVTDMQVSLTNLDWAMPHWESFKAGKTVTLPAGDGTKTVWVKFRDAAGKVSAAVSDTILLDTIAPVGKVLINGSTAPVTTITSLNVTLGLSAPGATTMRISLDGGTTWGIWEPFTATRKATLSALGDGSVHPIVVKAKFRDLTGNLSAEASATASYARVVAPGALTIPNQDSDGTYPVLWSASTNPGVTYVVQEATNSSFTAGLRTAYSGPNLYANITGRTKGLSYYYRVQATRTGYEASAPTGGANPCNVGPVNAPASITVPAADPDGSYTITWTASSTPNASYVLQEATDALFTQNTLTVYQGASRTATMNNTGTRTGNVYYYRVKAVNADFAQDSTWRAGLNPCKVGLQAPSAVVVPASADTNYTVSWTASPSGVNYEVQEATNASFSAGLRTITSPIASVDITGRTTGKTYYYRVRAVKAGFTATPWVNGANGCMVM